MKTVLVTGASSGIGHAIATQLAKRMTVFAGVRSQRDFDAMSTLGPAIVPVFLEVTDRASIANSVTTIAQHTGGTLDALVNNAGIVVASPLEIVALEEFERQIAVNVTGPLLVTQAFLPMIRAAKGRIVTIGSVAGKCALPYVGPYAISKFAVEAFCDALRMEMLPFGVKVSLVEPGAIKTPLWKRTEASSVEAANRVAPESLALYSDAVVKMQAMSAKIEAGAKPPDGVAKAVEHALTAKSPKARYVVGTDARVQLAIERLPTGIRDGIFSSALGLNA